MDFIYNQFFIRPEISNFFSFVLIFFYPDFFLFIGNFFRHATAAYDTYSSTLYPLKEL